MNVPKNFLIPFILILLSCVPEQKKEIVILYDRPPRTLDPHIRSEIVTVSILSNVYEALVEYNPDMRLVPRLLNNWLMEDSLTWHLTLRDSVYFHDGKSLQAGDVVYSLYRVLNLPESEMRDFKKIVDTLFCVGDREIKIETKFFCYNLLSYLTSPVIVPEGKNDFEKSAVGTGPYKIIYVSPDSIVLVRNKQYWSKSPEIARAVFGFVPKLEARVKILLNGDAQIITGVSIKTAELLKDSVQILISPNIAARYLAYNIKKYPFNNINFRRALALAINREEIVQRVYHNMATPANQWIPKGFIGYDPTFPPIPYNPDSARKLIKNLAIPPIRFIYGQSVEPIGRLVAQYLSAVGINLVEGSFNANEYWGAIEAREFDCYLISYIMTSLDAAGTIESSFHTSRPEQGKGLKNRSGYSNKRVDTMLDEISLIKEPDERLSQLKRLQRLLLEDLPSVPIIYEPRIYGADLKLIWRPRLDQSIKIADIGMK